jgi:hypothetical protein
MASPGGSGGAAFLLFGVLIFGVQPLGFGPQIPQNGFGDQPDRAGVLVRSG